MIYGGCRPVWLPMAVILWEPLAACGMYYIVVRLWVLQVTRSVPIVFVNVIDPVGAGYIDSLARPGGNATGFVLFEFGISGKWLELLKQVAPGVTRAAVLRDPTTPGGMAPSRRWHRPSASTSSRST
jgi:hypothetical protein